MSRTPLEKPCDTCKGPVGLKGPADGWQLPSGETVCDDCVKLYLQGFNNILQETAKEFAGIAN